MNEKKIKELESQKKEIDKEIKKLKEEKPKSDREILESIEELLKKSVSNKTHNDSFDEWKKAFDDHQKKIVQPLSPYRLDDIIPLMPEKELEKYLKKRVTYGWDWNYRPDINFGRPMTDFELAKLLSLDI